MLVAVIGESCVGKSTFAEKLTEQLQGEVFTGKDYLRLAKNETIAKKLFQKKLSAAVDGEHLIYVISEAEHLQLLPEGTVRVLMTADLELILQRFTARMRGNLPAPVEQMLKKKHGLFDGIQREYHIHNSENTADVLEKIAQK